MDSQNKNNKGKFIEGKKKLATSTCLIMMFHGEYSVLFIMISVTFNYI